jgi:hypothetical protein
LNTANGVFALLDNTTGGGNTANGYQALQHNQSGSFNTATGFKALFSNITGFWNTAYGYQALFNETGGSFNTAYGINALFHLTSGGSNIALGSSAGSIWPADLAISISEISAFPVRTIPSGSVHREGRVELSSLESRGARLWANNVVVNANDRLGTAGSSKRFKEAIKSMDEASEVIHALKPVTFRYKQEIDPEGVRQFGLVAEEVEKVNPEQGEVYTVRYEAVNAMLLNEFLKEHTKVEKLEATVAKQQKDFRAASAQQQKEIQALAAGLKEQASQIQKINAQVEVYQSAPKTVLNNR